MSQVAFGAPFTSISLDCVGVPPMLKLLLESYACTTDDVLLNGLTITPMANWASIIGDLPLRGTSSTSLVVMVCPTDAFSLLPSGASAVTSTDCAPSPTSTRVCLLE